VSEPITVRGEGGGIFRMTLPLHPAIQARMDAGEITRVNEDGSPWTGEDAPKPRRGRPPAKPKQ
jgi:hypothetical protein